MMIWSFTKLYPIPYLPYTDGHFASANSVNPDLNPKNKASDQGLHSFTIQPILCQICHQVVNEDVMMSWCLMSLQQYLSHTEI